MALELLSLFPRRDRYIRQLPGKDWEWRNGPLLDHQILGVMADGGRGLFRGCAWAHKTRFANFDIDQDTSKYHNPDELHELARKLAAVGLRAVPYQSSDSGGWHLYLFLDDWEESDEVATTLKAWLKALGYEIKGGTLEVFPSGNALRLPLQPGFAWLDDNGAVVLRREDLRQEAAISRFLLDLKNNANNWDEAKRLINSQLSAIDRAAGGDAQAHAEAISDEGFVDLFKRGAIPEICEIARKYWREGLTRKKQRHEAIYSLQHLLWFGDVSLGIPKLRNDESRRTFLKEWLERNHNGHCKHINRGQWRVIDEHIRRACQWRGNHSTPVERTPYMNTEKLQIACQGETERTGHLFTPEDAERANIKREEQARNKIAAEVRLFRDRGRKLTIRGLANATGCHRDTVRRHWDIWSISPAVALSNGTGQLDLGGAGVRGGSYSSPEEDLVLPVLGGGDSGDLEVSEASGPVELAPIVLTPPFHLPGDKPTIDPPSSISLHSLNGFLPSCAEPAPGPLHLPFSPIDDRTQVQWYSGRTADGAGGSEPGGPPLLVCFFSGLYVCEITNKRQESAASADEEESLWRLTCAETVGLGIIGDQAGQVSGTGAHPPVISCAHDYLAGVSRFLIKPESPIFAVWILRTRLLSNALGISLHHDVRGPPFRTRRILSGDRD